MSLHLLFPDFLMCHFVLFLSKLKEMMNSDVQRQEGQQSKAKRVTVESEDYFLMVNILNAVLYIMQNESSYKVSVWFF